MTAFQLKRYYTCIMAAFLPSFWKRKNIPIFPSALFLLARSLTLFPNLAEPHETIEAARSLSACLVFPASEQTAGDGSKSVDHTYVLLTAGTGKEVVELLLLRLAKEELACISYTWVDGGMSGQ